MAFHLSGDSIRVFVRTEDEFEITVMALPSDLIASAMEAALGGASVTGRLVLLGGDYPIDDTLSFADEGIEDGARLALRFDQHVHRRGRRQHHGAQFSRSPRYPLQRVELCACGGGTRLRGQGRYHLG